MKQALLITVITLKGFLLCAQQNPTTTNHGTCDVLWSEYTFGTCMGENNNLLPYDFGGDGTMELIVTSGTELYGGTGQWYILEYNSNTLEYEMIFMSQLFEDELRKIRIANIDQDPGMELLVIEDHNLHIYDLQSLEQDTSLAIPELAFSSYIRQIRFADANNDGFEEILIAADDRLIMLDPEDCSLIEVIMMEAGDFAIGNVDDDNNLEVLFTHGLTMEIVGTDTIHEYDFRPTVSNSGGFIELSDIDNDGRSEAIVAEPYSYVSVYDVELEIVFLLIPTSTTIGALLVENVEGNATDEIIYGDDQGAGSIYCHNATSGALLWSIPNPQGSTTGIAAADFDDDGNVEVAWESGCNSSAEDILSFHQVNNQVFEWNSLHIDGPYHGIETGDIDEDGDIEIVTLSIESNEGYEAGILTVYNAQTKAIEFRSSPVFLDDAGETYTLEIADYGEDNDLDIIVAAGHPHAGKFWIVDGDSLIVETEYEYTNQSDIDEFYAFTIDDIDGDNVQEFIASGDNFISVINTQDFSVEWFGDIAFSWPKPSAVITGNIDSDPAKEIVLCKGSIYVYDDGSYAVTQSSTHDYSGMILYDWNGTPPLEIIAGNNQGQIKVFDSSLLELESFQVSNSGINSIAPFNIDGSGHDELIITSGDKLYLMTHEGTVMQSGLIEPDLGMFDALDVSDYDGDGLPNIICGSLRGVVEINPSCTSCLWLETMVSVTDDNIQSPAADGSIELTVIGGNPPYAYSWNTGSEQSSLTDLASGNYTVTIEDSQGCSTDTTISVNSIITGIEQYAFDVIGLSPNPAHYEINILNIEKNPEIVITDALGRIVAPQLYVIQELPDGAKLIIDRLQSGVYIISGVSQNEPWSRKFVKL